MNLKSYKWGLYVIKRLVLTNFTFICEIIIYQNVTQWLHHFGQLYTMENCNDNSIQKNNFDT